MAAIPKEWIERLFERLEEIYGAKWTRNVGSRKELLLTLWSHALAGLTGDEIKTAIQMCKDYPYSPIPTPIEFYHYAKKNILPPRVQKPVPRTAVNMAIAHVAIEKMKDKLSNKLPKNWNMPYA
jgi:hypothetical protein